MDQKAARAAVAKAFKARGVKLRKGHWRVPHGEIDWYVDLRSSGPAPDARLWFEVGAWVPSLGLGKEPEGGAVDCSLLSDHPLDAAGDIAAQTEAVVDLIERIDSLDALRKANLAGDLPDALVDRDLRDLLTG